MAYQTQFGHTLLLSGFEAGSAAEKLERLPFLKKTSEPVPFDEAWLQRLIMQHPSLLPVDQIEPVFNTLVPICVELPTLSGFIDNLFVTPAGDIALVECKLWRNPEARRKVVAQIIDYAREMSTWTYETLERAIGRTRPVDGSNEKATQSLFHLTSAHHEIDEASFHDAVSRNLKRGRFLLLVVGDGIREGAEGLAEFLQQHAGFHFTLALVEIALFKAPGGYIAQPRVLARTTNIDRGIVTMDEGRIVFGPSSMGSKPESGGGRPTTITQERYFEELEKEIPGTSQRLTSFIDQVAAYNVSPEFGTQTMILRWRPDNGRDWNLGTIYKRGPVWMDNLGSQAGNAGLAEAHKQFVASLASLIPGAWVQKKKTEAGQYATLNGKSPVPVDALLADETRRDGWLRAIADFQAAVMKKSHDD